MKFSVLDKLRRWNNITRNYLVVNEIGRELDEKKREKQMRREKETDGNPTVEGDKNALSTCRQFTLTTDPT